MNAATPPPHIADRPSQNSGRGILLSERPTGASAEPSVAPGARTSRVLVVLLTSVVWLVPTMSFAMAESFETNTIGNLNGQLNTESNLWTTDTGGDTNLTVISTATSSHGSNAVEMLAGSNSARSSYTAANLSTTTIEYDIFSSCTNGDEPQYGYIRPYLYNRALAFRCDGAGIDVTTPGLGTTIINDMSVNVWHKITMTAYPNTNQTNVSIDGTSYGNYAIGNPWTQNIIDIYDYILLDGSQVSVNTYLVDNFSTNGATTTTQFDNFIRLRLQLDYGNGWENLCTTTSDQLGSAVCSIPDIQSEFRVRYIAELSGNQKVTLEITDANYNIYSPASEYSQSIAYEQPGQYIENVIFQNPIQNGSSTVRIHACALDSGAFAGYGADETCVTTWFGNGYEQTTMENLLYERGQIGDVSLTTFDDECAGLGPTDIFQGLKCAGIWLFIPTAESIERFQELSLQGRFPFDYVYEIGTVRQELFASAQTADGTISVNTPFIPGQPNVDFVFISEDMISSVPFADTIRTLMIWLLWIMLMEWAYYRLIRIHDVVTPAQA